MVLAIVRVAITLWTLAKNVTLLLWKLFTTILIVWTYFKHQVLEPVVDVFTSATLWVVLAILGWFQVRKICSDLPHKPRHVLPDGSCARAMVHTRPKILTRDTLRGFFARIGELSFALPSCVESRQVQLRINLLRSTFEASPKDLSPTISAPHDPTTLPSSESGVGDLLIGGEC